MSNPRDGGVITAGSWKPQHPSTGGDWAQMGNEELLLKHQAPAAKSAEGTAEAEGQDKGSGVGLAPLSTALTSATPSAETKECLFPSGETLDFVMCQTQKT